MVLIARSGQAAMLSHIASMSHTAIQRDAGSHSHVGAWHKYRDLFNIIFWEKHWSWWAVRQHKNKKVILAVQLICLRDLDSTINGHAETTQTLNVHFTSSSKTPYKILMRSSGTAVMGDQTKQVCTHVAVQLASSSKTPSKVMMRCSGTHSTVSPAFKSCDATVTSMFWLARYMAWISTLGFGMPWPCSCQQYFWQVNDGTLMMQ